MKPRLTQGASHISVFCWLIVFVFSYSTPLQAQWTPLNEPEGGIINGLYQNNDRLIACGYGGLHVSTDNGLTWKKEDQGMENDNIYDVVETDGYYFATTIDGIFRSEKTNFDWSLIPGTENFRIAGHENHLFAVAYNDDQLLQSVDGQNWENLTFNNGQIITGAQSIYVSGTTLLLQMKETSFQGLWISDDLGENWTDLQTQGSLPIFTFAQLIGDRILVYYGDNVMASSDMGQTWISGLLDGYVSRFGADENTIYAHGFSSLFRSVDDGVTWTSIETDLTFIQDILPLAEGLMVGSGWGIHYTNDAGLTWEDRHHQLSYNRINNIQRKGDELFASSFGIYRSTDNGGSWLPLLNPGDISNPLVRDFAFAGETLFIATIDRLLKTENYGATWERVENNLSGEYFGYTVSPLYHEGRLFIVHGQEVFYSDDHGLTWQVTLQGFTGSTKLFLIGSRLFISESGSGGTFENLWYSDNKGDSWESTQEVPNSYFFQMIAHDELIYGFNTDSLYQSTDNGLTWEIATIPALPTISNFSRNIFSFNGELYVTYRDVGIYRLDNQTNTWEAMLWENNIAVGVEYLFHEEGLFLAGTTSNGIFRFDQSTNTHETIAPPKFIAFQTYPNPTSDYLHLHLAEAPAPNSTIQLIDGTGRVLLEQALNLQQTTLNLEQFEAGVYWVEIWFDEIRQGIRKVVVH